MFEIFQSSEIASYSSKSKFSEEGPGYSYVLPCSIINEYLVHQAGLDFCLYIICQRTIVQFGGMLKSREVISDFECFRNKSGFIIKELAIFNKTFSTQFPDLFCFGPPVFFMTPIHILRCYIARYYVRK